MSISVKLDKIGKEKLEKLLAKLRLEAEIKMDQYKLLRTLISFGEENYNVLISYIKGVTFTEEEIKEIHKRLIQDGTFYYSNKSDDELIYGE
ncbi:MAG: hypothetical protein HeimC3_51310 [Candidatus Heimdallarchaeota archaeon LC_3]|nr:MAG: hypothetical protein HeimC3_51310 [Candidatus Heimdallarchaeota archaeon LC_3]